MGCENSEIWSETRLALAEGSSPQAVDLDRLHRVLSECEPVSSVRWAADTFGGGLVLTTSFGIQSAVMLHLATQVSPGIPVVWIDTGYLPPETYRFADALTKRLDLNLHVAQSTVSAARMEALHGRLWENDEPEAYDRYLRMRKVEPLERKLRELEATAWLSGVRADQTEHRAGLRMVERQNGRFKISPILPWHSRDVHAYLQQHDLPYHPLFEQGYATVGDWHASRPVTADDANERDTRFGGRRQECGIHVGLDEDARRSLNSSGL